MEETYITSEHSYQKPQSFGQDCKAVADPMSSDDEDTSSFEEDQELCSENKNCLQYSFKDDGMNEQVSTIFHLGSFLIRQIYLTFIRLNVWEVYSEMFVRTQCTLSNKSMPISKSAYFSKVDILGLVKCKISFKYYLCYNCLYLFFSNVTKEKNFSVLWELRKTEQVLCLFSIQFYFLFVFWFNWDLH